MTNGVIAVTGATGNIGGKLAEQLLAKGQKVRAFARNREKLAALAQKGAEIMTGSVDNPADLKKLFAGAKAAFLLIPPNYAAPRFREYQNRVSDAYVQALRETGVQYAVHLSSIGAHLSEKVGPIKGLYDSEQTLNGLADVNVLHLRPAFFMENHFFSLGLIRQMGIAGSALKGGIAFPMIATRDIASAAAEYLTSLNFTGNFVHELLGQRDLSMAEATTVLGKAIGKSDLRYVEFPYEDARKAMIGMGMSEDAAGLMVEMYRGFNEGVAKPEEPRSARNTTPTSIEDFAKTFAAVYNAN